MDISNLQTTPLVRGMPSAVTRETIKKMKLINQLDNKFLLTQDEGVLYVFFLITVCFLIDNLDCIYVSFFFFFLKVYIGSACCR